MYTEIRLLLHIHPFISSFFFISNFQTLKFFVTLFSGTVRPRRLKLGTHGQWTDVSCIQESGCCCLFVLLFLHFSFSQFFVTLFSGTVRLRDKGTVGRCKVCTGIRLPLLIRPFISSFLFLSIFIVFCFSNL